MLTQHNIGTICLFIQLDISMIHRNFKPHMTVINAAKCYCTYGRRTIEDLSINLVQKKLSFTIYLHGPCDQIGYDSLFRYLCYDGRRWKRKTMASCDLGTMGPCINALGLGGVDLALRARIDGGLPHTCLNACNV
jgi:hypothetical protein